MVASHLARCPGCHAYERDTAMLTRLLREAPLESSRYPVVVRRPRRVSVAHMQVGFAAALAVVVLGVAVQTAGLERQGSSSGSVLGAPVRYETFDELAREVQLILDNGRSFDQRNDDQGSAEAVPI